MILFIFNAMILVN